MVTLELVIFLGEARSDHVGPAHGSGVDATRKIRPHNSLSSFLPTPYPGLLFIAIRY